MDFNGLLKWELTVCYLDLYQVLTTFSSIRAPWYFVERKRAFPDLPLPNPNWLRKDYDTCVRRGDKECRYLEGDERDDFGQLTEFFCGQEDECT